MTVVSRVSVTSFFSVARHCITCFLASKIFSTCFTFQIDNRDLWIFMIIVRIICSFLICVDWGLLSRAVRFTRLTSFAVKYIQANMTQIIIVASTFLWSLLRPSTYFILYNISLYLLAIFYWAINLVFSLKSISIIKITVWCASSLLFISLMLKAAYSKWMWGHHFLYSCAKFLLNEFSIASELSCQYAELS